MIPLRDSHVPDYGAPIVTRGIILLTSGSYIFSQFLPEQLRYQLITGGGIVPALWSGPPGDIVSDIIIILSAFFATLIHSSPLHLISNMLYVWVFADNIEGYTGAAGLLTIYLISALGSALAYSLASPWSVVPAIGASGAVAGVLGAYVVMFPRARVVTIVPSAAIWGLVRFPVLLFVLTWVALQWFYAAAGPVAGGVSWWAHIGGFITGSITGIIIHREKR